MARNNAMATYVLVKGKIDTFQFTIKLAEALVEPHLKKIFAKTAKNCKHCRSDLKESPGFTPGPKKKLNPDKTLSNAKKNRNEKCQEKRHNPSYS